MTKKTNNKQENNIQTKPLDKNILKEIGYINKQIENLNKQIDFLQISINARINYIARKVCEAFGEELLKVSIYYIDDDDNDICSILNQSLEWHITVKNKKAPVLQGHDFAIILKDNSEWGLHEFPTRWLFEDFEDELINGVNLYKNKIANEKKSISIIDNIKSKLTKEELKVVGLI